MATNIYEFDTVDPSLLGWNTLLTNNFNKAELYNHTYLRYQVASGEVIVSGEVANLYRNTWRKAFADGVKQPVSGIFLESGISGEYVRVRTLGPLTANCFNFVGSGEYIYLNNSGELTSSAPTSNLEIVGYALGNKQLFIRPQYIDSSIAISDKSITYAKMQDISATARLLGRKSSGSGSTEELSASDTKNLLGITQYDETVNYDFGVEYRNTTGKTITVVAIGWCDTTGTFIGYSDPSTPVSKYVHWETKGANQRHTVRMTVPNNNYFKVNITGGNVAKDAWYIEY
ncbi:MAG: hypothetical protein ABFC98_05840 [Candidatus Cloacimonas sp.]